MPETNALSFFDSWTLKSLLVKVTTRCTFHCNYCFWFRDPEVRKLPGFLLPEVESALVEKLEHHIVKNDLKRFHITLHGGEPLLFGQERTEAFLSSFQRISERTGARISFGLQTNASLINDSWCETFLKFGVNVGVSLDGPRHINDLGRRTCGGDPTFDIIVKGIKTLQHNKVPFGVLSVVNPATSPREFMTFMVDELDIDSFDVLIPDFCRDDSPAPIGAHLKELFDIWVGEYASKGVRIRFFENIITTLLGYPSRTESIGYGPSDVITLETDGTFGPTDTLRIIEKNRCMSHSNILTHGLDEIMKDDVIRWTVEQSLCLAEECQRCRFRFVCGGGYLPHRWSSQTKNFRNPSVYCHDLKDLLSHMEEFVTSDVKFATKENASA